MTIHFEHLLKLSQEIGFDSLGVVAVTDDLITSPEAIAQHHQWIEKGMHADMNYLTQYEENRWHPRKLHPEANSLITVAISYFSDYSPQADRPIIAKYALGRDYHKVLKKKLTQLGKAIGAQSDEEHYFRPLVDTAPLPERYWAVRSGMGKVGKNTCLIIPKIGSFCFIGTLLSSVHVSNLPALKEKPESISADRCKECDLCICSCPTGALSKQGLDARRCINYWSIENRGNYIPPRINQKMGRRLVGCDTCQDVCPYNSEALKSSCKDFMPRTELVNLKDEDLVKMNEQQYEKLFFGTPLTRTKWSGMKRNITYYLERNKK